MLESLANLFYNPLFFWGLPLLVVAALGVCRRRRDRPPSGEKSKSRNDCPKNQT
jgi:MYXO-CTERM domain-containing protein